MRRKYTTTVVAKEPQPLNRVTDGGTVDVEIQAPAYGKAVSQCVGRVANALDIPHKIIEAEAWIELPLNVKDEATYTVRLTWPAFTRPEAVADPMYKGNRRAVAFINLNMHRVGPQVVGATYATREKADEMASTYGRTHTLVVFADGSVTSDPQETTTESVAS
jgi:hypothetical protein